jgi:hypothetical protein
VVQNDPPDLKIGDLEDDKDLLFLARDDAFSAIADDAEMKSPEFFTIRKQLQKLSAKEKLLSIG